MILIGLGHKCRQGKNYVADFMKAQDQRIKIYAFADELKLYCREHHDELVPQWQLANQTKQLPAKKDDPIYGYTPILQWYGSNVARKQDPDVWVKALSRRLSEEVPEVAVIADVRFPNEAEFIKKAGGFLAEVIRLKAEGEQYIDSGRDPNHISETALNNYDGWDFIIMAKDGDLKSLKQKSIGVLNLATAITNNEWIDEALYVDDPNYSDAITQSLNDQGDGFFEPTVD
jgi:hypothetical protein